MHGRSRMHFQRPSHPYIQFRDGACWVFTDQAGIACTKSARGGGGGGRERRDAGRGRGGEIDVGREGRVFYSFRWRKFVFP